MHYLLSVIDDTTNPVGRRARRDRRVQPQLRDDGHWVFGGGLSGRRHRPWPTPAGELVFTDGPFVETKEYLAGFWVIEAPDLDVALELAAGASKACHRKVEVRPFNGIA